jgi:hypothetical protein
VETPPAKMSKSDYCFIIAVFLTGAVYMAWLSLDL